MPAQLEASLRKSAEKKGYSGDREDAYVYGTMNKMGVMHGNKLTGKGQAMVEQEKRRAARRKAVAGREKP